MTGAPASRTSALVVGLGLSGTAAADALVTAGAHVRVVEPAHTPALEDRAARLRRRGVEVTFQAGTDTNPEALLEGRTLVVPSPGVPPHDPVLTLARSRDIEIISEPEAAWRLSRGRTRLVGITGTNGKTTVTEMVAACLDATPAGNIGTPLTTVLCDRDAPQLVVAELSSFQLKWTSRLAPDVAVVLNLADDHRDWHGSFVAYAAAKARIWAAQHGDQMALVSRDDAEAAGLLTAHPPPARSATYGVSGGGVSGGVGASVVDGQVWWRDDADSARSAVPVVAVSDLARAKPHDLVNVCAAVTVAVAAGADPAALGPALRGFRPGPHRLQPVATVDGVDYVDDSKATNPHAAAAALVAFPSLVWIAGGLNKGLTFEGLAPLLPGRVRAAVTIGSSGPALAAVARSAGVPVVEAGVLDDAVPAAAGLARPGDTVLLAPACASMDQFTDYADRGRAFRRAVGRLAGAQEGTDGG